MVSWSTLKSHIHVYSLDDPVPQEWWQYVSYLFHTFALAHVHFFLQAALVVDILAAYGPIISGVIYLGGGVLSLSILPQCTHPYILAIAMRMASEDYGEVYAAGESFVDSCFADPSALPFALKLQLMGSYLLQKPKSRVHTVLRQQDEVRWREEGRHIPVLIVQGTKDLHCLYENMITAAREVYQDVDVKLLDGAGHAVHLERPHDANAYILEFVRKVGQFSHF